MKQLWSFTSKSISVSPRQKDNTAPSYNIQPSLRYLLYFTPDLPSNEYEQLPNLRMIVLVRLELD